MDSRSVFVLVALGALAYMLSQQTDTASATTDATDSYSDPSLSDSAPLPSTDTTGYSMPDNATQMANLAAFLLMLRYSEGTATPDDEGYRALFGWRRGNGVTFSDFSTHPNIRQPFFNPKTQQNDFSTAAGAYQINHPTFVELGGTDFHPATQDALATRLIAGAGALSDIYAGNIESAISKLGGRWASLPSSNARQPTHSVGDLLSSYTANGGTVA